MEATHEMIFDRLVYSCAFEKHRGYEEYIPEHFLGMQLSGQTQVFYQGRLIEIPEGAIVLVRRNQLIRTIKIPAESNGYKFVSISLDREILQKFAMENKIFMAHHYEGDQRLFFESDDFLHSYFLSLTPYINKTREATPRLAELKVREAIELLLQAKPDFAKILFDFSEPYKVDLRAFMDNHYMFNVPVTSFAKLTGRSLSSFKRDFYREFSISPKQWLLDKRLEESYYLIKYERKRPVDFYLDLGFENISHFYHTFKRKFGFTTSEVGWTTS